MAELLTASLPGTGGTIKECPEDFCVEEIPLYLPCDQGEHLYIQVEKKGLSTFALIQQIASALGVKERDIGYAGLKDAQATTRQTLSVQGVSPEKALALQLENVRILSARRHGNKLRLGHLAGNRFEIRVRGVCEGALAKALDIIHVLQKMGVPNRFGAQRFGVLGNSHLIGLALLRRDYEEAARQIIGDPKRIDNERWRQAAEAYAAADLETAINALPGRFRDERRMLGQMLKGTPVRNAVLDLPKKLLRLYLSACQSSLFDRILEMRLATLGVLWQGDLAYKHANGACFTVEAPSLEQPRADTFEISPSAPLFGYKVTLARGQAGILEQSLLESQGLSLDQFRLGEGLSMEGERRTLRVQLSAASVRKDGEDLILGFVLPKGSYATSVLAEVMKTDSLIKPGDLSGE